MKNKINFLKNRFTLSYEYCVKKTNLKGYPVEITVELTNCCNLDCVFCPHAKMRRKQGLMDISLFKKIIDEAASFVESVDLDLMGESTMHPDIIEMIRYCKRAGLKTTLNSNMTHVDSKFAQSLIDSGLNMLVMSIDGAYKDTYEFLRRGAIFEKTKENIETLLSLNPKGLYRTVQMVYITDNKHEIGQFFKSWRNKGADFIRAQPYQNVDKQKIDLSALPKSVRKSRKVCIQPWWKLAVCWDGTAVLCCNDYDKFRPIGDANRQRILDIWNGELMQESRKKLIAQDWNGLSFCKDCFPFEPNKILLWGSVFTNPVQVRKLLFVLEKLMVFHRIYLFRYY